MSMDSIVVVFTECVKVLLNIVSHAPLSSDHLIMSPFTFKTFVSCETDAAT